MPELEISSLKVGKGADTAIAWQRLLAGWLWIGAGKCSERFDTAQEHRVPVLMQRRAHPHQRKRTQPIISGAGGPLRRRTKTAGAVSAWESASRRRSPGRPRRAASWPPAPREGSW